MSSIMSLLGRLLTIWFKKAGYKLNEVELNYCHGVVSVCTMRHWNSKIVLKLLQSNVY